MTYREVLYSQGIFDIPEDIRHIFDALGELVSIKTTWNPDSRIEAKVIILEWMFAALKLELIFTEEYTKISSWLSKVR